LIVAHAGYPLTLNWQTTHATSDPGGARGASTVELGYALSCEEHGLNRLVEVARLAEDAGFGFV
jgi:hypothetical protein